jgi:hypothetical protein
LWRISSEITYEVTYAIPKRLLLKVLDWMKADAVPIFPEYIVANPN